MKPCRSFGAVILAALALGVVQRPECAHAASLQILPGKPNEVRFESRAPLESFSGTTAQVRGSVDLTPGPLPDSFAVRVEVDLASFDTGIDKRNRHMRENHLETARFPVAVFRGARVHGGSSDRLEPGTPWEGEVSGTLTLHGVTLPVRWPVTLLWESASEASGGPRLRITAAFPVHLADYDIKRPKFLVLKLDEVQRVRVDVVATEVPE